MHVVMMNGIGLGPWRYDLATGRAGRQACMGRMAWIGGA